MSQFRARTAPTDASFRKDGRFGARVKERLRHLLWAIGISLCTIVILLFEPVDQFMWLFQSKIAGQKPSGDIVFVSADETLHDPMLGHRRIDLAKALVELDRRGVGKVYIDIPFEKPSQPGFDRQLAQAIAVLGPRVTIVDQLELDTTGAPQLRRTDSAIAGMASRVVADKQDSNYFGISWQAQYTLEVDGRRYQSLSSALGGVSRGPGKTFEIDYGFASRDIKSLPMKSLLVQGRGTNADLAGKTVVIGYDRVVSGSRLNIPNSANAPASYVSIYAGETLKSGRTAFLQSWKILTIFASLLACVIIGARTRKRRWVAYAALVAAIPASLILSAKMGIRIEASYALGLLFFYAAIRSWARWKRRVALTNQDTGLPTFKALETRLSRDGFITGHVVVAKVHNYERVLKTLDGDQRSTYLLKLVDRLRAADPDLAIFSEGHYLAWHSAIDSREALQEHLAGLRAIFAAPVTVAGHSVDVGITFGAVAIEGDPQNRVAAAAAAAEETNEALEPIRIADTGDRSDLLWDISLRARIDEAMEAGEIYCLYQPKIDRESGTLAGVEALVRWHDPARGYIAPLHFVQQCEKAGRMEHLTRYVLQSACTAGQLLHFRGTPINMSVNISATLLGDMRIVGIVRNVLQATRFDPRHLILEITETSRIPDLDTAAAILTELRALGLRISIDDFGMGAANFETFFALPFDELKIDRLFVSNMMRDTKARAIVSSLVAMGREARITIVAEGVETMEELEILNKIGCDELQGYVFSRPITLSKLLEFNQNRENLRTANMV